MEAPRIVIRNYKTVGEQAVVPLVAGILVFAGYSAWVFYRTFNDTCSDNVHRLRTIIECEHATSQSHSYALRDK